MEKQQRNDLINDIHFILRAGAVTIKDLNKQLRGKNPTSIDRIWCVSDDLPSFKDMLKDLGFIIVVYFNETTHLSVISICTKEQYEHAEEIKGDLSAYEYRLKMEQDPTKKVNSIFWIQTMTQIKQLKTRYNSLMGIVKE